MSLNQVLVHKSFTEPNGEIIGTALIYTNVLYRRLDIDA